MRPVNRVGLMLLIVAAALMLSKLVNAETLAMLPAHVPFRANLDPVQESGMFGLLCTIAAILFCW